MSYGTDADALNYLSKASSDLRGSGIPISVKEGKEIIKLDHATSSHVAVLPLISNEGPMTVCNLPRFSMHELTIFRKLGI